jgi:chloramphenicol-sensitive protein RarD
MLLAIACYSLWGIIPIYWKFVRDIPAAEVLIPRILWTLVLLWIVARVTGRSAETWANGGRAWLWTLLSALLLAGNWTLFIYAVQSDQIVAASLGYYINPLVSTLFGLVILGERLNPIQAVAIGIAAMGVATLAIRVGELPWISLVLATTFALYGLIHKIRPQPPIAGLARETMVLAPLALGAVAFLATQPQSGLLAARPSMHAYLALSAVVTAVPLLLFHAATRRLPLVAVGMFQYIAPTITLLLATFGYDEPFSSAQATGFGFVWLGLGVFMIDSLRRARSMRILTPIDP